MVKIYGRLNSINVQKVMWTAAEIGLKVDHVNVGGAFGGNDTPEYLAKNPNGRVPLLEDGEFCLWESNAIIRYLSEAYGADPWFSADIRQRAHAGQWMDWYISSLHPEITVIFWTLIRTASADRDMQAMEKARLSLLPLWEILDRHLTDRSYLLGDELSMADVPLGCACYRWHNLDIERPRLDHLEGWYQRLCDRPAFQQNVMLPLT